MITTIVEYPKIEWVGRVFKIKFPFSDYGDEGFAAMFAHFLILAGPCLRAHAVYTCSQGTFLYIWLRPSCSSVAVIVRFLAIAFVDRFVDTMKFEVAQLVDRCLENPTVGPARLSDQKLFLLRLDFEEA